MPQGAQCSFLRLCSVPWHGCRTPVPPDRQLTHFQSLAVAADATGHHLVHSSSWVCAALCGISSPKLVTEGSMIPFLWALPNCFPKDLCHWLLSDEGVEKKTLLCSSGTRSCLSMCMFAFGFHTNGLSHVPFCLVHFAVTYLGDVLHP